MASLTVEAKKTEKEIMGLGWNDGFAPQPLEPLTDIESVFWDSKALLNEAVELQDHAVSPIFNIPHMNYEYVVPGLTLTMSEMTPELKRFADDFRTEYGDLGDVKFLYLYIRAGEEYPWHVDNVISQSTGQTTKETKCAFNILLRGEENEVEFDGWGSYRYKASIFDTSTRHRITPATDRIMCKVTFKDLEYSEVVSKIGDSLNRKPPGDFNG